MQPASEQTTALQPVGALQPGQRLADGRYSLERRLRRSGPVDVFLARDHLLNRRVVVKLADCSDPTHAAMFKRQAQRAARLNHPGAVAVYDWGEDDGLCFVVVEHVSGPTLQDVLDRRGPMPEVQALGIAEQIAEALEAAHAQELVHGSLEPRAVVFDALGQVKVDDFGVPEAPAEAVSAYLAPEVTEGRPLDTSSDVYALGAVLVAMLTGAPPGPSSADAGSSRPRVSPLVEPIVAAALAADPAERYPTATALHDAIHEARVELLSALVGATQRFDGAAAASVDARTADGWLASRPSGWRTRLALTDRRLAVGAAVCALVALLLLVPGFLRVGQSGQVSQARVGGAAAVAPAAQGAQAPAQAGAQADAAKPAADAAACRFVMGFARLREKLPTIVGDCIENERWLPERNQTVQRTTRGLLVWRKSDGVSAFTDGNRTWLDGPLGLQERLNSQRFNWERD